MGFRDLNLMNSAMLAKQAWRLLKKLECLWGRCLKQLYHPTEDFLHVKRARNVSWSWSSLLHGRDIIQKHSHWSIANGEVVDIRRDKWLMSGHQANVRERSQVYFCQILEFGIYRRSRKIWKTPLQYRLSKRR